MHTLNAASIRFFIKRILIKTGYWVHLKTSLHLGTGEQKLRLSFQPANFFFKKMKYQVLSLEGGFVNFLFTASFLRE